MYYDVMTPDSTIWPLWAEEIQSEWTNIFEVFNYHYLNSHVDHFFDILLKCEMDINVSLNVGQLL